MKDIIKITASLTGVCLAAALILGAVYAKTEHARKENEERLKQATIQGLLGFGGKEAPADLKIYPIYRYVLKDPKGKTLLGYLVPTKDKKYVLVEIDLAGKPEKVIQLAGEAAELSDQASRDKVVKSALPSGASATYAETLFIAELGDKRLGYVVPGVTQGFKTFIKLMVSLNPDFTVTGVAITESEEDPGLGAEIQQLYFRNQFIGKTVEILKNLKVVKEPLPSEYLLALEPAKGKKAGLTPEKVQQIREQHSKDDIYAITGATISSRAVTNGVKDTVKKFVYRWDILKKAMNQEQVAVAFERR